MIGRVLLGIVLTLVVLATCRAAQAQLYVERVQLVRVTYYVSTGNPTASGAWPVAGWTAACSFDLPLGTWVRLPDGVDRQCVDRGQLTPTWVDIYVDSHAEGRALIGVVGETAIAEVW